MSQFAERIAKLSPKRLALLALELQSQLEAIERSKTEPIAIIGIGCRFPGDASDPEAFWRLLRDKVDAISEVPAGRWDIEAFYDPNPQTPGKMYTRWGGFIEDVETFDAQFFGIAPREALSMDPQQRVLLEVSWEALENAGQVLDQLSGSKTGVYMGICTNDYARRHLTSGDPTRIDAYSGTGAAFSVAIGRLSYLLGLQGPNIAVDTACSSSLVAVHLACQSLRNSECDLALAGGVNLILAPENTVYFCKVRAMAADGRCKTFDAAADGYVRGEGCGVVVLKRLSDAVADGDPILALIRGSAINQDGRSNGLTAPNGLAQEAVIRTALANAGVEPAHVSYIEAHGTGTSLGDPIEVRSLAAVLSQDRSKDQRLLIGSVKTNIGHLEAAAGVAGLIKVVLALQHAEIPPHLHVHELNPHVSWDELPVVIPTERTPWPAGDIPRIAGVSSFGFSGTNAHVIVQEAPPHTQTAHTAHGLAAGWPYLLPLSAHSPEALRGLARSYRDFLIDTESGTEVALPDLCYTASVRRSHHPQRLTLVGDMRDEFCAHLEAFLAGETRPGMSSGWTIPDHHRQVVFVFSGQGPQRAGMGQELFTQEPVFREVLEQCDDLLRQYADWSLLHELAADAPQSRLVHTEIAQPALFAVQVGLAALWRSWGIVPDAVVGHSVGEVAAAHIAGVLSLEDAIRVVFHRGRLMQEATGQGKMAAVELAWEESERVLAGYAGRLSLAAINSPTSVVLSGEEAALREVLHTLAQQGIAHRMLPVDYAFHSPQMTPFQRPLVEALADLAPQPATIPIFSTVTSLQHESHGFAAAYWGRNMQEPVRFAAAIGRCAGEGHTVFVELSPHPVLAASMAQCLRHRHQQGTILASLRRGQGQRRTMLATLGALHAQGYNVNWRQLYRAGGRCIHLPSYPWQRQRFWLEEAQRTMTSQQESRQRPDDSVVAKFYDSFSPETLSDLLYEIQWQPKARSVTGQASTAPAPVQPGTWLIFADRGGVGKALGALLVAHGERCVLVTPGHVFERVHAEHFQIRPEQPEDMRQLLGEVFGADQPTRGGVVHLWSLDASPPEETTVASLQVAQTLGCGSVLHLVQGLTALRASPLPRLWLVTRGAQAVASEPRRLAVAQAPLWGFGRTIALEHPSLWGGMVDLNPAGSGREDAPLLWEEIRNPDGENQIAFYQGQRYVARLVRRHTSAQPAGALQLHPDGTYLISGGLGGIGLELARWMVQQGARQLILLGRSAVPPRASWNQVEGSRLADQIAVIQELETLGAHVYLPSVDIADEGQLAAFLEDFRRKGGSPIRGVVHAAALLQDRTLIELDTAALNAAFRPKVTGGWLLHCLLKEAALDFFVLFSSLAAVSGSPGQANYSAANAFLDALTHDRRAQGLPALSVNWGHWSGLGQAALPHRKAFLERLGIESFTPNEGLEVLGQLLRQGSPHALVMRLNMRQLGATYPQLTTSPLLSELNRELEEAQQNWESVIAAGAQKGRGRPLETEDHPNEASHLTRDALLAIEPTERQKVLESYLRERVSRVLMLSMSKLDVHQPLNKLGIDSLMGIELKYHIERDLEVEIPLKLLVEGPSVAQFSTLLLAQLTGADHPASVSLTTPDQLADAKANSLMISLLSMLEEEKSNE